MSRPLLTKVLAEALRATDHRDEAPSVCGCEEGAREYVDALHPAIADHLEWALGLCVECRVIERNHRLIAHAFVPLVQP